MKFKQLLAGTLAFALISSLSVGCSNGTGANNGDKANKGQIVVTIGMWPQDTLPDNVKMFENFKKTFEAANPNVKIVADPYVYAPDTFVSLAQSGKAPTVFECWFSEPQKLISAGMVADITDEVKALGWYDDMNPSVRNLLSANGKLYGIPRDGYALGLQLNLNLFKQAGLVDASGNVTYPKTLDDMAKMAVTIKGKTGKAGLCLLAQDNSGGWQFANIAWEYGAELEKTQNGKTVANLNSPEAVAAMKYISDLKWKYNVLNDSPATENWASGFKELGTGQAAMYIAGQDAVDRPTQVNGLSPKELSLVPLPAGPSGQYMLMGGTPYMFAANASKEQITAALKFIETIGKAPVVTPDALQGMKDDARNRVDQGIPVIPTFPVWTNKDFLDAQNKIVQDYSNVDMKYWNDFYSAIAKPGVLRSEPPDDSQDMYSELTKVLQAVISDKNANIQKLMDKANKNFQSMLDQE